MMAVTVQKGQSILPVTNEAWLRPDQTWTIGKDTVFQEMSKVKSVSPLVISTPLHHTHKAGVPIVFLGEPSIAEESKTKDDKKCELREKSLNLPAIPEVFSSASNRDRKCIAPVVGFPKDRTDVSYWHAQLVQNVVTQNDGAKPERERTFLNSVFETPWDDDRLFIVPSDLLAIDFAITEK